jgi:hypothetical protein
MPACRAGRAARSISSLEIHQALKPPEVNRWVCACADRRQPPATTPPATGRRWLCHPRRPRDPRGVDLRAVDRLAVARRSRSRRWLLPDKLALFSSPDAKAQDPHSDETSLTIVTRGRWYTLDGLASQWNAERRSTAPTRSAAQIRDSRAAAIPQTSPSPIGSPPERRTDRVRGAKVARFNVGMLILSDRSTIDTAG